MTVKSYRKVFATVGTTQFDKLVAALDTVEVQMALKERLHAEALTIQVGNTKLEPKCTNLIYMTIRNISSPR